MLLTQVFKSLLPGDKKPPGGFRIVYLCPAIDEPAGGIKVIYKHSEVLNRLGFASVVYHPDNPGFSCSWFEHQARFERQGNIDRERDFVVIPENWAARYGETFSSRGIRHAIFVQNGYNLYKRASHMTLADVRSAYAKADLILAISEDTRRMLQVIFPELSHKLLRVYLSVDIDRFHPEPVKQKIITFMPRRLRNHAELVQLALERRLPDWKFEAIENLSEAAVVTLLKRSHIFLSFSGMEGFGLPPLEAALCGNHVVGYDGQAGKEYWLAPNFERIELGDICAFVNRIEATALKIAAQSGDDVFNRNIAELGRRFSLANEAQHLQWAAERMLRIKAA